MCVVCAAIIAGSYELQASERRDNNTHNTETDTTTATTTNTTNTDASNTNIKIDSDISTISSNQSSNKTSSSNNSNDNSYYATMVCIAVLPVMHLGIAMTMVGHHCPGYYSYYYNYFTTLTISIITNPYLPHSPWCIWVSL